ncbi:MAG: hypothetical protein MZW92_10330 [Comamonadaceae bacterium]|nr:hypothetical protein [Comamonadaceae bacterium]
MENGRVTALPVSEIDFSAMPKDMPRILGYDAKWFEDHPLYQKTPPVCPAPIDDERRGLAPGAGRGGLPDDGLPRLRPGGLPDGRQGAAVHPRGQSQPRHQHQRGLRPGPGRGRHRVRRRSGTP